MKNIHNFDDLLGHTLLDCFQEGVDRIVFVVDAGPDHFPGGDPKKRKEARFALYHSQDCCESVTVENITGDLKDLIGSPLTMAEEVTSKENPEGATKEYQDSFTWTFYKLATINGYVDIRWYGESNGYYSESVDFGPTH